MKVLVKGILSIVAALTLLGCREKEEYNVGNYYSEAELKINLSKIIPYIAKLENGVNYDNRFDSSKKDYFEEQQKTFKFSIEQYKITADSNHYFLIWKVAPSLYKKKIAIGGRYKKDSSGKIYAFEEIFNTAKMPEEELKEKSFPLFDFMVKNGNVNKFLGDYLLIEFPDDRCTYDKENSRWVFVDTIKRDTVTNK